MSPAFRSLLIALDSAPDIPCRVVGSALLFALRVNSATYRGFADDMATHIACNRGEAAYKAFNEILCHHGIRDCDAPTPVACKTCGNGVAEMDEACDGTDLGGKDCTDLGFSGGELLCDANCALDDSKCVLDVPTTGMDSDLPTSTSSGTDGTSGSGDGSESSGGDGGADDGCGCKGGNQLSPELTLLLGGSLIIRRRRRGRFSPALGVILAIAPGCQAAGPVDNETGGSDETTATASSTGDAQEVLRRMIGTFFSDDVNVGHVNPMGTLYFWGSVQIDAGGTLVTYRQVCDGEPEVQEFSWMNLGDSQLQVVPEEFAKDGTFKFLADPVTAVTLMPGEGCDDVTMILEYHPDSGKPTLTTRFLPGLVCAEPLGGFCNFEFVWCDGVAPPVCG